MVNKIGRSATIADSQAKTFAAPFGVKPTAKYLEVAEKLCDKVAIIKGGKLVRSGTMEQVKGDDSLEEVFLELEGELC